MIGSPCCVPSSPLSVTSKQPLRGLSELTTTVASDARDFSSAVARDLNAFQLLQCSMNTRTEPPAAGATFATTFGLAFATFGLAFFATPLLAALVAAASETWGMATMGGSR